MAQDNDWFITPPLPDKIFPWEKYNPVTREEVADFFNAPEVRVIKQRMVDIGRRLWQREFVDGNGGNISVRVAQNLLLCSPTLCSKGFMTEEDICLVDMNARQKAGYRPATSEVKTHIAMMRPRASTPAFTRIRRTATPSSLPGRFPRRASIPRRTSSSATFRWRPTARPVPSRRLRRLPRPPSSPPWSSWRITA